METSFFFFLNDPELGTLERDTFNPDCLIQLLNVETFDFLLNPLFFGYSIEKTKTDFSKLKSPPILYINLKWRAISNFPASDTRL